jgi:hypothetical protein
MVPRRSGGGESPLRGGEAGGDDERTADRAVIAARVFTAVNRGCVWVVEIRQRLGFAPEWAAKVG